jgi:glutamate formiminotransferase/formiminotetrahydrofolate cyclodeaminase
MPQSIVECIPNFSEARRPEVVDAIVQAVTSVSEVRLLDRSSNLDHNRTVLTFAGPPLAVEEAAFRAIQKAAELIDMNHHTGEHPRIGATDVVPFVPISGVTMDECVAIARRLGQRVGEELDVPVYLYEMAAACPDRVNLENIRRGQYEGLKTEIETNPDRKPDFGPACLGPAGATVIGARNPLIAYNIYLTSDDVNIAKAIAKAVRYSSGGLRYVKALGLLVEGRAQVSMNLTNYQETPIPGVVETIRREAARYGVNIHHSELVGLIPQSAIAEAAAWYLQLDGFKPDQILEQRLFIAEGSSALEFKSFLDALADGAPTPGGGSAAAYAAAMGAALVSMVARLTTGKKKYAEVDAQFREILEQAESLRAETTRAVSEDASAFTAVMEASKLPKDNPEQEKTRAAAIKAATLNAAHVPLRVAKIAVDIMALAKQCVESGNQNAVTDAASGVAMARAGLTAAGYNIRINVINLTDSAVIDLLLGELVDLETRAARIEKDIYHVLRKRSDLSSV